MVSIGYRQAAVAPPDLILYRISLRYGIFLYKGFPFIRNIFVSGIFLYKGLSVTMDLLLYETFLYKNILFYRAVRDSG